jgi:superfamily II DNA or RNA helicase
MSGTVERGSLLKIPKALVDVEALKERLSVVGKDGVVHTLWTEDAKTLSIPRNFPISLLDVTVLHRQPLSVSFPDSFEFRGELLPHQRRPAELLAKRGDKGISLGCGRGKTVISLKALCARKALPFLVVVPTTALQEQWRLRIASFTTLPLSRVGRGTSEDILKLPANVVVLNTAAAGEYEPKAFQVPKVVIFDEAHRLGAPLMRRAAERWVGERWWLSATPDRDDGMEALFLHHVGPCVHVDTKMDLVPQFAWVDTGLTLFENEFIHRWSGRLNTSKLLSEISFEPDRALLMLEWIRRAAEADRNIMVMADRRDLLVFFHRHLPGSTLFVGTRDSKKRSAEAATTRILLADSRLAKEGLDKVELDTLFLTTPIGGEGRFQQTIGRILRVAPNKPRPLCVAFRDNVRMRRSRISSSGGFVQALYKRMESFVAKNGYEVVTDAGSVLAKRP